MKGLALLLVLGTALSARAETTRIQFDFSRDGAREVFHTFSAPGYTNVESIAFTLKCPYRHRILLRVRDATGQVFQRDLIPVTGVWWRYTERLSAAWELIYGGAKDRRIHQPLQSVDIYVHNPKLKSMHRQEVLVKDLVFERAPAVETPKLEVVANYGATESESTLAAIVRCPQAAFAGGKLAVRWLDWDGHSLRTEAVECPALAAGAVWTNQWSFISLPRDRNAMFAKVALKGDGIVVRADGPAWARRPSPVRNAGVKNSKLPWATGIYAQRWGLNSWALERRIRPLVESARDAGIKWLREQILWYQVSRHGKVDFAPYDAIVDTCEKCGMSLCMLYGGIDRNLKWTDPDFCERYVAALRQTVRHYRGRVAAWELCNEPNLPWPMDPRWEANYRRLMTMATQAIHEEDPAALSVGGSASGLGVGFLKSLAAEGHDEVSIHPYRRYMDEPEFLADMQQVFTAAGNRKIWITEIGWTGWHRPFGGNAQSPEEIPVGFREQASQLARAYMTAAASSSVRMVAGYDFVDDGPLACGREAHLGILHGDCKLGFLPKPAYLAIATIGEYFQSGEPALECREDGVVIFRMGLNFAVWGRGLEPIRYQLPPVGEVVNLMGEPAALETDAQGGRWVQVDANHLYFIRSGPGGT